MSGVLFSTAPGTLVAHKSTAAPTAALIKVEGLGQAQSVILTGMTVKAETAYQVTSTIGGPQYLFPFGDKLQPIELELLVFPGMCQSDGATSTTPLAAIWQFYYNKRITPDKIQTVKVTFGGQTITGLVVALQCSAALQESVPIISCTLSLVGWAEDTASTAAATATANQAAQDRTLGTGSNSAASTGGAGLSNPGGYFTTLDQAGTTAGSSPGASADVRAFLATIDKSQTTRYPAAL